MRQKNWMCGFLTAALLAGACAIRAQEPPLPPEMMPGGMPGPMMGDRLELLGFGEMGGHKTVKGTPFSGTAISETTHVLADGNTIHRTTQTAVFRDSEGRVRKEVNFQGFGPLAAAGKTRSFIVIHDPAAGASFMLEPEEKIARKLTAPAAEKLAAMKDRFAARRENMEASGELKTESLGTQTIEGVAAEGTRYTRVIPAGQIGNEKPIEIVSERWFSKDLQETVMIKRSDPRFGTTTYRLTNIQRQEPAATLFQVPADYTVKEGGGRHRGRFGNVPPPPPGM